MGKLNETSLHKRIWQSTKSAVLEKSEYRGTDERNWIFTAFAYSCTSSYEMFYVIVNIV